MKREEILSTIKGLSRSQGMYGRLYEWLMDLKQADPEVYEEKMKEAESRNFKDSLEFVLAWEEGDLWED